LLDALARSRRQVLCPGRGAIEDLEMNRVIDGFVQVLATSPEPVLPSSHMGAQRPAAASDLPAIAISLILEDSGGIGLGCFVRAGHTVVQHTGVVEVQSTPQTFSTDLRSLRIWPLPLKRNPSSTKRAFSEDDLQIRNVTNPTQPVQYRMVDRPAGKVEYELDIQKALALFGEAQTAGEKLEVVHWTVTWRDDILGDRYRGELTLELWARNLGEADDLSRRLQARLKSNRPLLRQTGFLILQPARLEPLEQVQHDPPAGSPFSAWRQRLGYRFAFECEEGGELSSGVPIKRIDVSTDQQVVESFSIPS
jgi:hypothetical protein